RRAGIRFNADLVLNAFLERLGENGTLVIPAFNYDLKPGECFDVRRTPTISGALGQAALSHSEFARTAQPLHSFAVAGGLQRIFLQADDPSSFGPRSAFALLREHEFQLIAIDMPLEPAFTYVHFVEESSRVPYRRWRDIPIRYTDHRG
ncbi:MAG: AAC(3) family N-acetyltransferase, partial [Bacteroidota bacterium]|nr:AAC(3) family N-acetyltransferase [Bacteroidota bacterium]